MTEQTIQSLDINIGGVFKDFYAVPDYQREYVWETEQVEQLLGDINAELAGNDPAHAPEYFIGSIVVCPGNDSVLELIDGQQRMTTLFLMLCAVRDRLKELGEQPSAALGHQIAATSIDVAGAEQFRYRLDLQYEDSGDILVRIAKGAANDGGVSTRSIANILTAYATAIAFLRREFADDPAALRRFYGYVINKVKLIRIRPGLLRVDVLDLKPSVATQPSRALRLSISLDVDVLGKLGENVAQAVLLHSCRGEPPERIGKAGSEGGLRGYEALRYEFVERRGVVHLP